MSKRGHLFADFEQLQPIHSDIPFVMRPDYIDQEKQNVVDMFTSLFKVLIGEESDVSGWTSVLDPRSRSR